MYKTSVAFVKAQTPGLTINELIRFYRGELDTQSVSSIISTGEADTIHFTNNTIKIVLNRYKNKFSCFSKGQIKIVDEGGEFVVYLEADLRRMFISSALRAGLITLLGLLLIKFDLLLLLIGSLAFIVGIVFGYLSVYGFFPVYFERVRNEIERVLQRGW